MTLRMSAVAACCSRASFNSLPEAVERFNRMEGPTGRLVLAGVRPFTELALRVFAALVLPPVLDGRAIYAPKGGQRDILSSQTFNVEGAERARIVPASQILMPAKGHLQTCPAQD